MELYWGLSRKKWITFTAQLLFLCFLGGRVCAVAQVQTTSELGGTVSDASGGVVPGATITLTNQNTGAVLQAVTNGTGSYGFLSIPPGTYTVMAVYKGFKTAEVTNRVAQVAEPAVVDFKLEVGQITQTVTVSAEGADLIDSTTAEVSGTINQQLVNALPLNGGDFLDLTTKVPGTNSTSALGPYSSGFNQESQGETALMRVSAAGVNLTGGVFLGGNRDTASNISVDGSNVQNAFLGEVVQLQSPSDIQEVKVESGVMNAEFGFGTGAVNTITKSGTNQFNGEVFEFLRNNDLDATNYFTKLAGLTNPGYRMNQFGASVGGPILKNKLHFFGNYAGLRINQSTFNQGATPPASIRGGDFSTFGNGVSTPVPSIYNPYQSDPVTGLRTPFPGNKIPLGPTTLCSPRPTCVDPAMLAYLQYSPLPNGVIDGIAEYSNTTPTTFTQNQYTVRIDWDKSGKTRIFGRFTHFNNYSFATAIAPIAGEQNPFGSINPVLSWVQILTPRIVNNLTVSYTRGNWADSRATNGIGNISEKLGLTNTSLNPGGPTIGVTTYTVVGSKSGLVNDLENNLQLKEDFDVEKGRHQFKIGVQANIRRVQYNNNSNDKGVLTYQDVYSAACPLGNAKCAAAMNAAGLSSGGLAFADYMLGAVEESVLNIPGAIYDMDQVYYGGYAQDSWRVSQKLTLNLGLRYDYWTPWLNVRRMAARWDSSTGNVVYALQNPLDYLNPATNFGKNAPLTPGEPPAGYRSGRKNFAPRVGVAYLLTPNTTVRAGAGIYFDGNTNLTQLNNNQSGVGPFSLALDNKADTTQELPSMLAADQFPAPPPTAIAAPSMTKPISIRTLDGSYYPVATVYQWSLSIQRRLARDWVIESTYLGTHSIRENQFVDLNIPNQPLGALGNVSMQQRRQFSGWQTVGSYANVGWAKYNALTTSIKTPQWKGLTLMSWFAFSRDMVSGELGSSSTGNIDFRHFDIWAGPSLINPDLRNVNTWSYELPVGKGRRFQHSGPVNWVAGGWTFSGSAEFSKGGHQYVSITTDTSSTGQTLPLADQLCNPAHVPGGRNRLEWFNTSCFAVPAFGQFGNSRLGSFVEPGVENWDLALRRSFPIPRLETNRLQFQADFFNAWNHTQWGYVTPQLGNASFGRVGSTHPARQIQLALKYAF